MKPYFSYWWVTCTGFISIRVNESLLSGGLVLSFWWGLQSGKRFKKKGENVDEALKKRRFAFS